jgi:hypothetical protein
MRRRNLIPLALLAVLAVLTVLFAALAASSSPDSSSLVVQNATGETFGYPDGASSFSMHLIETAAASTGAATTYTQVRLVNFSGPGRMAVYGSGAPPKLLAVLDQPAIDCARRAYTAMVGGATPWAFSGTSTKAGSAGSIYRRTESLAAYSSRVPRATSSVCAPQTNVVRGTVYELAIVRSGFLVSLRTAIVVPPQTVGGGTLAAHGVVGEILQLLQINGTPVGSL